MPYTGRNFENLIAAFEEAGKDSILSPKKFQRWAVIAMIAAIMGRRVWFQLGEIELYPNMHIALVGPPSAGKGSALILPFRRVYHALSRNSYKEFGLLHRLYMQTGRISSEKLAKTMSQRTVDYTDFPNFTNRKESSVALVTEEIGTLLRKFEAGFQNLLTEGWDAGEDYPHATIGGGEILVEKPCITWISCATLDSFIKHFPQDAQEHGYLSRVIIVYHPWKSKSRGLQYPKISEGKIRMLMEDASEIARLRGPMKFETQELFDRAHRECEEGLAPTPADRKMKEYCGRRQVHAMKLAMCMSAAKRSDMLIKEEDWEEAKEYLFSAEKLMPQALTLFGMSETGKIMYRLRDELEVSGPMKREIFIEKIAQNVKGSGETNMLFKLMQDIQLIGATSSTVYPILAGKDDKE